MASKMKTDFVLSFAQILADEGDMFFSSGDVEQDYDNIITTIKNQGYWAGTSVRYFFNDKLEFEGVQERIFGA